MKNIPTIICLLVACSLLGSILWVLENHPVSLGPEVTGRLVPEPLRDVDQVTVTRGDGLRIEMRRVSMSNWQIVHPVSAPAATDVVMRMLDAIEQAPCFDYIDGNEMALRGLSPIDFGADKPRGGIVVSGPRGRIELLAGATAPVSSNLFVFRDTSVLVTDSGLARYFEMPVEAFSDTRIFRNDPRKANVVTLNRGRIGFVKLVRNPGTRGWKLTQPLRTKADWDVMKQLFDVLYSARISRYAQGDFPQESIPPGGYGLDGTDAVVVQVATLEDPVGQLLTIGSYLAGTGDQVFVRAGTDGAVSVVTGAVRRVAMRSVSELRDKSLFSFKASPSIRAFSVDSGTRSVAFKFLPDGDCLMTAPVSDHAAPPAVSRLLDSLLGLSALGFFKEDPKFLDTAPVLTVSVDTEKEQHRLSFVPASTNSVRDGLEDLLFAIPGELAPDSSAPDESLPVVSSTSVASLLEAVSDPRPLVSGTVLRVDAKNIRRISFVRGGATSGFERVEGNWQSVTSTNGPAMETLTSWLEILDELKATRVEALSEGENDLYSLASPSAVLTVDLIDATSSRIVLLLGGRAPDGGCYGRLQGHDVVFVLPQAIEQIFARPQGASAVPPETAGPSAASKSTSPSRK